jgi:hypothetical protein
MITKTLYKFTRPDGGTTISPNPPEQEYTTLLRLISDEGKMLTKDGINFFSCTDVDSSEGWYEVLYDFENEEPIQNIPSDILEKAKAYDALMGISE